MMHIRAFQPHGDAQRLIHAAHVIGRDAAGAFPQTALIEGTDLLSQNNAVLRQPAAVGADADMRRQAVFVLTACDGGCNDGGAMPVADLILYDKYRPYAPLLRSHDRAQVGVKNLSAVYFHRKDLPLLVTESISRGRSF